GQLRLRRAAGVSLPRLDTPAVEHALRSRDSADRPRPGFLHRRLRAVASGGGGEAVGRSRALGSRGYSLAVNSESLRRRTEGAWKKLLRSQPRWPEPKNTSTRSPG